jgi:hypothetical protein
MRTGELRHQQAAATLISDQSAENCIRHTRHGRQDSSWADRNGPNLVRVGKIQSVTFRH